MRRNIGIICVLILFLRLFSASAFAQGGSVLICSGSGGLPVRGSTGELPSGSHSGGPGGSIIIQSLPGFITVPPTAPQSPPPKLGFFAISAFSGTMHFGLSADTGHTFTFHTAPCSVNMGVTHSMDSAGVNYYNTELLSIGASGGTLPPGVELRESPTKASAGKMSIDSLSPGEFRISSFFDVFIEVSLDGGATWNPINDSMHVTTRPGLQPVNVHCECYPYSTVMQLRSCGDITVAGNVVGTGSLITCDYSAAMFAQGTSPAFISVQGKSVLDPSSDAGVALYSAGTTNLLPAEPPSGYYSTEMLSLNLFGGNLPAGTLVRESPSKASRGQIIATQNLDSSYNISSFFDVFFEVSTDGGGTWSAADRPVYFDIQSSGNLSPGSGGSISMCTPGSGLPVQAGYSELPAAAHQGNGGSISLLSLSPTITSTGSPGAAPALGLISFPSIAGTFKGALSTDGGVNFTPYTAPVSGTVIVAHAKDSAGIQSIYTEMLSLSISGGNLPGNVRLRENPNKLSSGHARIDTGSGGYRVDSFFDIFFEVSLDGGGTWTQIVDSMRIAARPVPKAVRAKNDSLPAKPAHTSLPNCSHEGPSLAAPVATLGVPNSVLASGYLAEIRNLRFDTTVNYAPPSVGGSRTDPVHGKATVSISTDGGATFTNYDESFTGSVHTQGTFAAGSDRYYDTEMLSLDISGGAFPLGTMVRESPTRASRGQTTITSLPGGQFNVTSFFDVWIELSTDGGATWMPMAGADHIALTPAVTLAVNSGWNMVSLPTGKTNVQIPALFTTAVSKGYYYDGSGYQVSTTMNHALGYWLKCNAGEAIGLDDTPLASDTENVLTGWNMIGAIGSPIAVTGIGSVPGGIITSRFFGYAGSYAPAETLRPGAGYWVKVNQNGKLALSTGAVATPSARIRIQPDGEMPPPPPEGQSGSAALPKAFALEQNYPNPFNPATTISYALPQSSRVRLSVFNMLGQEIAVLADGLESAGYRSATFDAGSIPSGVYFYRLRVSPPFDGVSSPHGLFTDVKKLVVIR